jgi:glutamate synthase (NADPH/NADH) small chain
MMAKPTGFMEFTRAEAKSRPLVDSISDYSEFHGLFSEGVLVEQAARCMDCGIPFCHAGLVLEGESVGCPLGNAIPEVNDLVYRGLYKEAYARLRRTHPFPEFTGRVCPALCEGSCTLGEHEPPVAVKEIEHFLSAYAADMELFGAMPPARRTGRRVAVIGSGPAGLACADRLNQLGESVTVYERADRPGGLLMYGIPAMKLEKHVVTARVEQLQREGIEFVYGVEVGKDVEAESLIDDFDAVVLCCGATVAHKARAKNADADGVVLAMDYLTHATRLLLDDVQMYDNSYDAKGKDVLILGAGDTGTDCVATALRQKAKSIVQFQRSAQAPSKRSDKNPWPLWPRTLTTDYGHNEAIAVYGQDPREYQVSVKEILTDEDGKVRGVITVAYDTVYTDGRKTLQERPGSEQKRSCDMIIVAMGFAGPERLLPDALGLECDARSNVATLQEGSYRTSREAVFTAGDMHRGQSLVVWALKEGREAADEVHEYLKTLLPAKPSEA